MGSMTPLTQYILEQAEKAKEEGLSEADFFEQWSSGVDLRELPRSVCDCL